MIYIHNYILTYGLTAGVKAYSIHANRNIIAVGDFHNYSRFMKPHFN
jgi:hypothetical protein